MSDTLQKARPLGAATAAAQRPETGAWSGGGGGAALPLRVAVLIPCYNEEVAIPRVVAAFRAALPQATVYVYDNNSRDRTREAALAAGAVVRTETLAGQGPCGAAHVRRHRGRRLPAGGWRRHLRRRGRARDGAPAPGRAARHGDRRPRHGRDRRLPPRAPLRQRAADRHGAVDLRRPHHRHAVGLPRLLAPLREELPGARRRLRDRDRVHRPRPRTDAAGGRGRHRLQGAAGGLGQQAPHLQRRFPHPAHHRAPGAARAAR